MIYSFVSSSTTTQNAAIQRQISSQHSNHTGTLAEQQLQVNVGQVPHHLYVPATCQLTQSP